MIGLAIMLAMDLAVGPLAAGHQAPVTINMMPVAAVGSTRPRGTNTVPPAVIHLSYACPAATNLYHVCLSWSFPSFNLSNYTELVVQTSTNRRTWTDLVTNPPEGFVLTNNAPVRFYRLKYQ